MSTITALNPKNTTNGPDRWHNPSVRLGLAKYLACRELSLLVRQDENMCPAPVHPKQERAASPTKSPADHCNANQEPVDRDSFPFSYSMPIRRRGTTLSLTDTESEPETESQSGSYRSLPTCLNESCATATQSMNSDQKEQDQTLSTNESLAFRRSRIGSMDLNLDSLLNTNTEETFAKARAQSLKQKATELEAKYNNTISGILKGIQMLDTTYGYALSLFKTVMVRIDSAMSCKDPREQSAHLNQLAAKINQNPSLFRDTEKLFKVCIYEAYKVIEDEYCLYLEDFALVSKINKPDLEELELFIVDDVMQFRMVNLLDLAEEIAQEVQMLNIICFDELD